MTNHKALIARLQDAMEGYDSDTLGDDPHEFDSWQLLYDAKAALEALIAERAVVEAQALEQAADDMFGQAVVLGGVPGWLRARAVEIREGRQ